MSLVNQLDCMEFQSFYTEPVTMGESSASVIAETFCDLDEMDGMVESVLADEWCNGQFWVADPP